MRWNWQIPDWPDFRFNAERFRASEEQFLKGSGVVVGALHHLDADARDGLTIELISQEIVDSSARASIPLKMAMAGLDAPLLRRRWPKIWQPQR